MPRIKKTLSLKVAVAAQNFGRHGDLQNVLRTIHRQLAEPDQRRTLIGDRVLECRIARDRRGASLLYFAAHVPDDPATVITHGRPDLTLLPPPAGADFLDGELMVLVRGNEVVVCKSGLHEVAISAYVDGLAEAAGLDRAEVRFLLMNRTDVDQVAMIEREGVAGIRFDGVASQHAIDRLEDARPRSIRERLLGKVSEEVNALLARERRLPGDAENLKVEVFIKYDKRSGTQIGQRQIASIAETAVADEGDDGDGGYQIETLTGRKLRARDVLLNKKVVLRRYGKSVAFDEVADALLEYYLEVAAPAQEE